MKNKFLLSVAASALLTTSAFAATEIGKGELSITSGGGISTIEYHDKYGDTSSLDFTDLEYTAQIKGSGAVSDALVRINVTDTNLSASGLDLNAIFTDQRIMNNDTNETVAIYDKSIIDDDGDTWILFAGDSDQSIINGKEYRVRSNDSNDTSTVTYQFGTTSTNTIELDVWSTSGSEEQRDYTKTTTSSKLVPQFTTSCITKFDGLINIEVIQDSFVNTAHDNNASGVSGTDGLSQTDTLVFTVNNNQEGDFLEGNATAITMQTRNVNDVNTINVDNNFSDANIWTASATVILPSGEPVAYTLPPELTNVSTIDLLRNNNTAVAGLSSTVGAVHYTTDGNLTFVFT